MPSAFRSVPHDRSPDGRYVVSNLTGHHVAVAKLNDLPGVAWRLGPWEEMTVSEETLAGAKVAPWEERSIVEVRPWVPRPVSWLLLSLGGVVMVGFWALVIRFGMALPFIEGPSDSFWMRTLIFMAGAAALAPLLSLGDWESGGRLGVAGFRGVRIPALRRAAVLTSTVIVVVVISVGLPLGVIISAGGWEDLPAQAVETAKLIPGGASTTERFVGAWERFMLAVDRPIEWALHQDPARLVGSGLQLLFITTLSLLPALFFFQFDRQKLATLRTRFFRSVVLLDPTLRTLRHAHSVYGARADDLLGTPVGEGGRGERGAGRLVVLLSATLLVTLGWITTLNPLSVSATAATPSVLAYFQPEPSPFVYAFLGAYVFGIGMLFRRYVRSDLTPEAYAHFTVRAISSVLIAWAVLELPGSATELQVVAEQAVGATEAAADTAGGSTTGEHGGIWLALAFLIGFFPETGLSLLKRAVAVRARGLVMREEERSVALERLEGINVYHQSRLLDEGVENVENLAHADIIELMLDTRIPLPTLVDWIDQAILLGHVPDQEDQNALRDCGIRTATDLEAAFALASDRDPESANPERFFDLLPAKVEGAPARLRIVLDAVHDDEWMQYLRRCRSDDLNGLHLDESMLEQWDLGEEAFQESLVA